MDPQPPLILIVAVKEPTNSAFRYRGHNCRDLLMDMLRSYTSSTFPIISPGSAANAVSVSTAIGAEVVLCISNPHPAGLPRPFDFQGNISGFVHQALWDFAQAAGVNIPTRSFESDVVVMAPSDTMYVPGRTQRRRRLQDEGDQVVPVKRLCLGENGASSFGGGDGAGSSGGAASSGGNF